VSPPDNLEGLSSAQLRELVASLFAKITELERAVAAQREEIARLKDLRIRGEINESRRAEQSKNRIPNLLDATRDAAATLVG
jgi:hypothetical protein